MNIIPELAAAAVMPVAAAVLLCLIDKKTAFGKLDEKKKQLIYGIIFSILAILATKFGVPVNGAQANCRDASVMTAGLMFGAPAGIISGFIGGIERWISASEGTDGFTALACTISTVFAGFFSAGLRKIMFEDKKSEPIITCAIGVVIEVFHMTMIMITNMTEAERAVDIIGKIAIPMIVMNGASVGLSSLFLRIMSGESLSARIKTNVRISQTIQRWLFLTVFLAFSATSYFVFSLQNSIADVQCDTLLGLALEETSEDINDASDRNLLNLTHEIAAEYEHGMAEEIVEKYDIAELSVIDKNGIITESTVEQFIGFDMASGEQSAEFLCLLDEDDEFVQKYGPISYDSSTSRKYAGVKYDDGFIQVGYDAEQFQNEIDAEIVGITKNRHVGQTGYTMIFDSDGHIVSAPKSITEEQLEKDADGMETPAENRMFEMKLNNENCFCKFRQSEGYYIISVLTKAEAFQIRNVALYVNTFLEILVFAILFGIIYLLIKRVVVNQIKNINSSLSKITGGDLNEVVNVRTNVEFASLSDDINTTVDTLKRYINEASARIDAELEFAKQIQISALPNVFPAFPKRRDFDIFASMKPAKEVGGDFYDLYMTGTDTLHILIADVSGKGIPAAMFMMRAKTELKSLTESDLPINEVFTRGNAALCEGNDAGMFVTAWQGDIDLVNGVVRYVNAGHNPPVVRHKDGKFEFLRSKAGFVLAGMEEMRYKAQEFQLTEGDIIYLYTDGVTEATNAENILYGNDRLLEKLNSEEWADMEDLCKNIKSDVDGFVGDASQFDDITMLAFRYIGTPPPPTIHFDKVKLADIAEITEFTEKELEKAECSAKTVIQVNVAIDEICSNIINHGYPDEKGPLTVSVIIREETGQLYIRFTDEGIPYNPLTKDDPDITLSAEERSIGGLGIYMVKKTMDEIKYKYENNCNILTIRKEIN